MRQRRLKVLEGDAVYHCVTRVVSGEMLLDDQAKEILRKHLWQTAAFCGVELLTCCIMTNHFYVLVRVPNSQGTYIADEKLIRCYRPLYPKPTKYRTARAESLEAVLKAGGVEAEALRKQLGSRMYDASEFIKTVKQRFSVWYNCSHNRYGTLWAERFKSVRSGTPLATCTVAAYIDLNPVRAGLAKDPKDYCWCG
ncbi:transposase [Rubellicoccus peritrichatus]|uniref:Transposase n=1 Tax=Rubellicoccus peritrichatus TaxID=3080537 RepID=A0AAQ3L9A5_9BACT|nr:transposase [Puniceicoccus sp. CR14]WOO40072.1 transposase [Puniceicoccus sp. CR14]